MKCYGDGYEIFRYLSGPEAATARPAASRRDGQATAISFSGLALSQTRQHARQGRKKEDHLNRDPADSTVVNIIQVRIVTDSRMTGLGQTFCGAGALEPYIPVGGSAHSDHGSFSISPAARRRHRIVAAFERR
jgi:hypothetical protein